MTTRVIHILICDRCKEEFKRREDVYYGDFHTMEIGWFLLNNGSGSKRTTDLDRKANLDYDMCNSCTENFRNWWKAGNSDG